MEQAAPQPGVVVCAMSGIYAVETGDGVLLCRPRGRLRARGDTWRDQRDAERVEGRLDALVAGGGEDEGEDAGEGGEQWAARAGQRGGRRAQFPGSSGGAPMVPADDDAAPAVLAGDRVTCSRLPDGEGAIDHVLPRTSLLLRPPVANADHVIVAMAWAAPPFSPSLVDRLLLEAAIHGCGATVVCNKSDLLDPAERRAAQEALAPFRTAGFGVCLVSAATGEGLDGLRVALAGRLAVFAGPSGSGKSRLLGALIPDRPRRSAALSARLRRGRHTTRAVELLPLPGGGWIADTPGFSRLDLDGVEAEDLSLWYSEFRPWLEDCRFRGCLHDTEPACAVRAAVSAGTIDPGRYERYRQLLAELRLAGRHGRRRGPG